MNGPVFYNDNDAYCAQWLRNLIEAGHLPAGDVDERSIIDVRPADLVGYQQCHFFAGIGGWPYALSLAGWRGPVWTGSVPCQPLSVAGQRLGHADERHFWPAFYALIAECRPATIFGEQVASKDGREWFSGVRADLEHLGYALGCADLSAASVGAPHIRQRLFWVAESVRTGYQSQPGGMGKGEGREGGNRHQSATVAFGNGANGWMDDTASARRDGARQGAEAKTWDETRLRGSERRCHDRPQGSGNATRQPRLPNPAMAWSNGEWLTCLDGKARRVEPSICPLAYGVPARVGRLRAYGNAIVPQVAAEFVRAFIEIAAMSEERTTPLSGGVTDG